MTTRTHRVRRLRLALAGLVAGTALFATPYAVRTAYATDGTADKCEVTCSRGSCSAEGACTCTCSLFMNIATCTCTGGGSGGSGGGGNQQT